MYFSLDVLLKAKRQLTVVLLFSILYNVPKFAEVLTSLGDSDIYYVIYSNILYLIFLLYLPLVSLTFVNVRLISALKALKRKRQEMQQVRVVIATAILLLQLVLNT